MKELFTTPELREGVQEWLQLFNLCVLKTQNEAVVEGMGSTVDKHAKGQRHLNQENYASETFVDYNGPESHECEGVLTEALHRLFKTKSKGDWRFNSIDRQGRAKPWFVSKLVDRHKRKKSKLSFLV